MTFLIERLAELRRHLDHLRELRPRVESADDLRRDLSLHNDVLYSLLAVCQHVIDIAGELASRQGLPFADYTEAVRHLVSTPPTWARRRPLCSRVLSVRLPWYGYPYEDDH